MPSVSYLLAARKQLYDWHVAQKAKVFDCEPVLKNSCPKHPPKFQSTPLINPVHDHPAYNIGAEFSIHQELCFFELKFSFSSRQQPSATKVSTCHSTTQVDVCKSGSTHGSSHGLLCSIPFSCFLVGVIAEPYAMVPRPKMLPSFKLVSADTGRRPTFL